MNIFQALVCAAPPGPDMLDILFGNIANVLLFADAGLALVFILLYQLLATWEKSPFGIHVMSTNVVLFLVLTLGVGATIFGNLYPGRQIVRSFVFLAGIAMLGQQIYLLLREQIRSRHYEPPAPNKKEKSDVDS